MTRQHDRDEGGFVTVWALGLTMLLLGAGAISFDLWRALSERRELAAIADAAANAAANGIDEPHYRATGQLRLDPRRSSGLAVDTVERHANPRVTDLTVDTDTTRVTVELDATVPLTLLRIVDRTPFTVTVRATAELRDIP